MVSDFILIVASVLLFGTVSAFFLYYRRIIALRQEYYTAKGIIKDIVVSVDNQFKRQKDRVLFVAQKIENIVVENEKVVKKVEEYEEKMKTLTKLMTNVPNIQVVSEQFEEIRNEVVGIKETQTKVMKKLIEVENIKQQRYIPETKIDAAIPIKKESALAPLTETELAVLEIISREEEKTAPEIREKIGLTREHSARLMKKLYKDGYLERDTHKMPYVYRLKKEMEKILKKRETSVS
jgi:DNA-binding MarR family transcriptional regulator